MSICVQVYDNDGAFSLYDLEASITVLPDLSNLNSIMNNVISANPFFATNIRLNQGSYLDSLQELQTISSLLNEQSLRDKGGLIVKDNTTINYFPLIYGPLTNFAGVNHVSYFKAGLFEHAKQKL